MEFNAGPLTRALCGKSKPSWPRWPRWPRRYRLAKKDWPADLAALVPAYLAEIPGIHSMANQCAIAGFPAASPSMRSGSMASITRARWIAQSKCRTGQTSASSSGISRNAALNLRTPGDPPSAKWAEVVDSGYFQKSFGSRRTCDPLFDAIVDCDAFSIIEPDFLRRSDVRPTLGVIVSFIAMMALVLGLSLGLWFELGVDGVLRPGGFDGMIILNIWAVLAGVAAGSLQAGYATSIPRSRIAIIVLAVVCFANGAGNAFAHWNKPDPGSREVGLTIMQAIEKKKVASLFHLAHSARRFL